MSEFGSAKLIPIGGERYDVSYGDDSGLFVEFYWNEIEDKKASEKEGRPIFKSKEFVRMIPVGDKTKKVDRPVRMEQNGMVPSDPERFPRQWQRFKNQDAQPIDGTPITEWAAITRSDAASLKAMGIHTVELLAGCGDNNLTWLGARQLREKARAWIDKAQDNSVVLKQAKEIADLKQEIESMKAQFSGFAPVKKKGRKPNAQNAT